MICKLCGVERKLIRAHVIPAAFFDKLRQDSPFESVMYTFDADVHPKRVPKGIYDRELVCDDCEKRFQAWDDYAARLLLQQFASFEPLAADGDTVAWYLEDYDRQRLRLFFISVLWRAAASAHPYYRETRLGPFEDLAKEAVLHENPGDADSFSTVLARWHSDQVPDETFRFHSSPYQSRIDGVNVVRLYMGEFVAYVKVDRRPFPIPFSEHVLGATTPLTVVARDPLISDEFTKSQDWLRRRNRAGPSKLS